MGRKKLNKYLQFQKIHLKIYLKYGYHFQQFENFKILKYFNIYTAKINIDEAEMDQSNLLENMVK